ncbi:elongation factor P [Candidatus Pantoea carbekii]|uniref:Elongation factor P n=1 Tax=Candidatus Pantoea carbekii TaxID=1235990 RepID=U3U2G4_9GAMM|nr:elongation factor P [Candidatus Pantoea carbekii]AKC32573.1 elongation factor P Efp [Candidatus Pantoea carbekii]BAO00311.1 Efp protein [Candidatus Pantoea carbekii]
MTTYFSNDFRSGLKIIFEGEPYTIESSEFVKPGKGQAFVRVKMRRLLTGSRIEKTFKASDSVESADIKDITLQYSYNDGTFYYFMHQETFDQYQVEAKILDEVKKWLQDNAECIVTLWNDRVIAVQPPNFIETKIINTDPGLKGDTASGSGKRATISTGAIIKVPLFIQIDEIVKVDTRSGEYVCRVKLF